MEAHPKDMRVARPDNIVLDITVFTTLFTLIVTGTLATILQMDKDGAFRRPEIQITSYSRLTPCLLLPHRLQ